MRPFDKLLLTHVAIKMPFIWSEVNVRKTFIQTIYHARCLVHYVSGCKRDAKTAVSAR